MKPNDKAYAAARKVAYNRINKCFVFDLIKEAVDAAYAAQFPPSGDYDWLIKRLRGIDFKLRSTTANEATVAKDAADVLEAVLAERDALLARLAPVDDKELVEIAADAISTYVPDQVSRWGSIKDAAIDAIAAIRPHIEAAESERIKSKLREIDAASRMGGIFTLDSIIAEIDAPQQ